MAGHAPAAPPVPPQPPPQVPPLQPLVKDADSLLATVRRLHALNDVVIFWNEQRSFKLMLRNDPIDAETVSMELAMVFDDDDEVMLRIVDLTNDGYVDEPGTFVLDSWTSPAAEFGTDEAAKIMKAINDAYTWHVCRCGSYLIKDDAEICVFCCMTRSQADKAVHFCAICCEEGMRMHMDLQACCAQHLHRHCLATWRAKSGDERCPLCRQ